MDGGPEDLLGDGHGGTWRSASLSLSLVSDRY
jgi:hypothetical protein